MITLLGDWAPGVMDVQVNENLKSAFLNIEGPVLTPSELRQSEKLAKAGPNLHSQCLPVNFKIIFANLANNHISDYGEFGIDKTIEKLKLASVQFGGVVTTAHSCSPTQVVFNNGMKIAVISFSETQFGDFNSYGFGYRTTGNWVYKEIEHWKKFTDRIIVSCHGGLENSIYPSINRRNFYRNLIDMGVDVIYGHHPHKPQGWEFYKNGLICYGLGNFATDPTSISHENLGKYSLVVDLDLENLNNSSFRVSKQKLVSKDRIEVEIIEIENSEWALYFEKLNEIILEDSVLHRGWRIDARIAYNNFHSNFLLSGGSIVNLMREIVLQLVSQIKSRRRNSPYRKTMQFINYHLYSNETNIEIIKEMLSPNPLENRETEVVPLATMKEIVARITLNE